MHTASEVDPAVVPVAVSTDLVVLTVCAGELQVLLIRRGIPPYRGRRALPGGFLRPDESLHACARRELREETGLALARIHVEQLGTYGDVGRDPRGRVVSVAYLALVPDPPVPTAGTDARAVDWLPAATVGRLAFDHGEILSAGIERARAKLEYAPLATAFCPPEFTMSELRGIYEAVWGRSLDPRNFQRKVLATRGFVESTGRSRSETGGRPAKTYMAGAADSLNPPLTR